MPDWKGILDELNSNGSQFDIIRRKYLRLLHEKTGRNVIIYYSGWLQAIPGIQPQPYLLHDGDKTGFMTAIHELDPDLGLDLFLHTPGGSIAATESVVDYLRSIFGTNIRAIVPQLAMSAGTMIACACKEIVMGKQSSLGPIDPQVNGLPAHGILEEFREAQQEVMANQARAHLWQPIVARYSPALLGECDKAIKWSETVVREWLESGMFADEKDKGSRAKKVVHQLGSHSLTLSHERHISMRVARDDIGLVITALEDDEEFQDLVLSVHHACVHTMGSRGVSKIIENHNGAAFINRQVVVQQQLLAGE